MSGAEIAKTGEQTYRFEKGRFTTCRCEARRARALGDQGGARRPRDRRLRHGAQHPLRGARRARRVAALDDLSAQDRASDGAAVPGDLGRQPQGLRLRAPVLLGRARERERAAHAGLVGEARLRPSGARTSTCTARSRAGSVGGAYHHDVDIDAAQCLRALRPRALGAPGASRTSSCPADVRAKSEFAFASDNQYPTDFGELGELPQRPLPAVERFAGRNFGADGRFGLLGAVDYADDLQSPDDLDRDEFLLQRRAAARLRDAPGAGAAWLERLVPALDVQYVYFRSQRDQNAVFADTGIDGLFDAQRARARERAPGQRARPRPGQLRDHRRAPSSTASSRRASCWSDRGQRGLADAAAGRCRCGSATSPRSIPRRAGRRRSTAATRSASSSAASRPRGSRCARGCAGASARALTHLLEPRLGYALPERHRPVRRSRSTSRARRSSRSACASWISRT